MSGDVHIFLRLFYDTARVMCFLPYGGRGPVEVRGRRGRLHPIIIVSP